jgi:hypothetical protein
VQDAQDLNSIVGNAAKDQSIGVLWDRPHTDALQARIAEAACRANIKVIDQAGKRLLHGIEERQGFRGVVTGDKRGLLVQVILGVPFQVNAARH